MITGREREREREEIEKKRKIENNRVKRDVF